MNNRLGTFIANIIWFLSCLPGWFRFARATRNVKKAQQKRLTIILRNNAKTEYNKSINHNGIYPVSDYCDYAPYITRIMSGDEDVLTRDQVESLQPTSGSTDSVKFIPCTKSLRNEFKAAISPWIASLYLRHPSLCFSRQYWSISPAAPPPQTIKTKIKIGFADDSEYLGNLQKYLARRLFAAPPELAQITDQHAHEYCTLLFLCRERSLGLVSIWHPSFLTLLLTKLPGFYNSICRDIECGTISQTAKLNSPLRNSLINILKPDPRRARELRLIDTTNPESFQQIWPHLGLISCWTDGVVEPWLSQIRLLFPKATIQGKGLIATEGIVSIPFGRKNQKVLAINSHHFEFKDESGNIFKATNVESGKIYSVIITTGGGLYRYQLHDLIRVTGFLHQAPCIEFISREHDVCDIVGEKINSSHVERAVRALKEQHSLHPRFSLLAPRRNGDKLNYVLYIELENDVAPDYAAIASTIESDLNHNFHYNYARRLGQLGPVKIFQIERDADLAYRRHFEAKGMRAGDIKFQRLSREMTWSTEFTGREIDASRFDSQISLSTFTRVV